MIGAPLDVTRIDKKIMINAPWSHDSLCTYTPQGVKSDDPAEIARFIDVSLRFFAAAADALAIHRATFEQFREIAKSAQAPFKITAMGVIDGLGAEAFYVEMQADAKSDFKTAVIMFVKDTVGGAVSAWKKPDASLALSKSVLQRVLTKLPR